MLSSVGEAAVAPGSGSLPLVEEVRDEIAPLEEREGS